MSNLDAARKALTKLSTIRQQDPTTGAVAPGPYRWRSDDGLYVGDDGGWLYVTFDTAPLEWEDPHSKVAAASGLHGAVRALADTSKMLAGAMQLTTNERQVHIVAVTTDERTAPPPGTPDKLAAYQQAVLGWKAPVKTVFLGVKLRTSVRRGKETLLEAVRNRVADLVAGEASPVELYLDDLRTVFEVVKPYGAKPATPAQMHRLEAWYADGGDADALVYESDTDISVGRDTIEMAAVMSFDITDLMVPFAQWAHESMTSEGGPQCISIRGSLQPAEVARNRLRRNQRKLVAQMAEEAKANDLERVEDSEKFKSAQAAESFIAMQREPIIAGCSIIFGARRTDAQTSYVEHLRGAFGMRLSGLAGRQLPALDETLPCSRTRLNPFPQDVSIAAVTHSGIIGFSSLGDDRGIYVGMTDPYGTPCFLDVTAAPRRNLPAVTGVIGDSGSGKLGTLGTRIATPTGFTTFGEVQVGDEVLGRDGRVARVTHLSEIEKSPELHDVHLSDGQVIRVCVDHQWVVASFTDRAAPGKPTRKAAQARFDEAHRIADRLARLAERTPDDRWLPFDEVEQLVAGPQAYVPSGSDLRALLRRENCPTLTLPVTRTLKKRAGGPRSAPGEVLPVEPVLRACRDHWAAQVAAGQWTTLASERVDVVDRLLATDLPAQMGVTNIARLLLDADLPTRSGVKVFARQVAAAARAAGIVGRPGQVLVEHPDGEHEVVVTREVLHYPAAQVLRIVATKLRRQFEQRPSSEVLEKVMTTGDMLDAGLYVPGGGANFAIRVTEPLQLPEADLPVDPYVLGAWLGDGTKGSGRFTAGTTDACTDPETDLTDQAYLIDRLAAAGYDPRTVTCPKTVATRGLHRDLRKAGVLDDKHIPDSYLRASYGQRLELLRGLMDTDGTIDADGGCEFTQCDERLAHQVLELIRTLGIKASINSGDATITEPDPDNPAQTRRRVTGTRWRILFTTDVQVFSLPRKAARVPTEVRATQQWLYITDITPAPTEPGRCITVDSPDHTYLVEGMVPTHNTFFLQSLATQAALAGHPVVFVNPKGFDSLAGLPALLDEHGIPTRTVHLSSLQQTPGVFDPFGYAQPEEAAEIAAYHILGVISELSEVDELNLTTGLKRAALAGARSVGQALEHCDPRVADIVRKQCEASSAFALGVSPTPMTFGGMGAGLTLIEFDRQMDLPDPRKNPADYNRPERIAIATMKLISRASMHMLTPYRDVGSVFIIDEAWALMKNQAEILEAAGRLGRSYNMLPIFATQLISDVQGHHLENYMSRVLVMKLDNDVEAKAALEQCRLEPTSSRIGWLKTVGAQRQQDGTTRPATGLLRDLDNRHAAVVLHPTPPRAVEAFSTNPEDRKRRAQQQAEAG